MAASRLESKIGATFALRCFAFGIVMALANMVPYVLTRDTDGVVAGWPFRCYDLRGEGGFVPFHPWEMAGNIVIAVTVSAFAAWLFRHGVIRTLRKWPTWGKRMFRKFKTWGTPSAK